MYNDIYILIAITLFLLVSVIVTVILIKNKRKNKSKPLSIQTEKLLEALGGNGNILSVSLDNKRLKVLLDNPKMVSQTLLKNMEVSGFLTGKELKLLIKDNPVQVKNDLDKLRNEAKK